MGIVDVGRNGFMVGGLGNPYRPTPEENMRTERRMEEGGCVWKYRRWLWGELKNPESWAFKAMVELARERYDGRQVYLVCPGCPVGHPHCHARVVESALDWFAQEVYPEVRKRQPKNERKS